MTDISVAKQSEFAVFVQEENNLASRPVPLGTFGYGIVESLEKNKGDLSPIVAPDPLTNEYDIIDTVRSAPQLGTMSVMEKLNPTAANYLEDAYRVDCEKLFLIKHDCNGRKDDLTHFDSVFVIDGVRMNNINITELMAMAGDSDTGVQLTSDMVNKDWERCFPLRFAQVGADTVLAEIVDIIYADAVSCGTCAPYSAGNQKIYALQVANSGSPGLSAQIVYSLDGGQTWTALDIPTLGGVSANAIRAVGSYLAIFSEAYGGHVIIPKGSLSTANFAGVTSGYQGGGSPRTAWVQSVANILIGGAGGYIYRSTDIAAEVEVVHDASLTTENVNAIHGYGQTVVTVHDGGVVLISNNGGKSFSAGNAPDSTNDLRSVYVRTETQWYIGSDSGKLWYTMDGGSTYTQRVLPKQDTIDSILDIKFSPDSNAVGALSLQRTSNLGEVYTTISGGTQWLTNANSRHSGLPTNERINAVALYGYNEIAAGGKLSGSTDGIIAIAKK